MEMGKLELGQEKYTSLEEDVRKLSNHMFDLVYDIAMEHKVFVSSNSEIRRNLALITSINNKNLPK